MDSKIIKFSIIIFIFTIKVYATEFNGKFIQGHFIIGNTYPSSKVIIDKKEIKVLKIFLSSKKYTQSFRIKWAM